VVAPSRTTAFRRPYLHGEVYLSEEREYRAQAGGRRSGMGARLTFKYDRAADILHIDKCAPYPEQESEELGDEVIARLNPQTGEVENLEVLFFSTRLLHSDLFELPVTAELHIAGGE
jgi:uncharacterized protein YuzE